MYANNCRIGELFSILYFFTLSYILFCCRISSTVIKLITEELKPPEGEIRRNPKLRVGVYNQHFVDRLPMEEDPVTYLRRLFSEETYQSCRNRLGKYGLEGHAHTIPIRDLSGGQKVRATLVVFSILFSHYFFIFRLYLLFFCSYFSFYTLVKEFEQ